MATALIGFTFIYVVSLFICVIVCYLLVSYSCRGGGGNEDEILAGVFCGTISR